MSRSALMPSAQVTMPGLSVLGMRWSCIGPLILPKISRTCWACSMLINFVGRTFRSALPARPTYVPKPSERGLAVASKPDSHDICFIANGDTAGFLERQLGRRPGDIVDLTGAKVGQHAGSHRFTIGQRRGLGLGTPAADGERRFVLAITPTTNTITVGPREALGVKIINAIRPTWTGPRFEAAWSGQVQVRAHGQPIEATVQVQDDHLEVLLDSAITGVAPGQALVLYSGSRVVGSATISDHPGVTATSSDGELPPIRTTGIGSWPGSDMADAIKIAFAECPDLPYLPELPARGPYAELIGRSTAFLAGLAVDLQPAGWRLTDASSREHRLAISTLRADLDLLEEHAQDYAGAVKLSVGGPWTLAAMMERPRGDRVIADSGARRDLSQSLAEGITQLIGELRPPVARCRIAHPAR